MYKILEIFEKSDELLNKISAPVYISMMVTVHILYFITFVGILQVNSTYIHYLDVFIQLFICIFLMLRFNPLREHKLHKNDSIIIFGSAIFLLSNLGVTRWFYSYADHTVKNISHVFTN
jgi:hypothetical protein